MAIQNKNKHKNSICMRFPPKPVISYSVLTCMPHHASTCLNHRHFWMSWNFLIGVKICSKFHRDDKIERKLMYKCNIRLLLSLKNTLFSIEENSRKNFFWKIVWCALPQTQGTLIITNFKLTCLVTCLLLYWPKFI